MTKTNNFEAGAAEVDITPTLGTIIGVDFLPGFTRFIHDPLFVKTLIFKDSSVFSAIIIVDICIMDSDYMDEIKQYIFFNTNIPPSNILLAANHNHATGCVINLLGCPADLSYRKKLPGLILESVGLALKNLKIAKIANSSILAPEYLLCRRYAMQPDYQAVNPVTRQLDHVKTNPFGGEGKIIGPVAETDPELSYLAIKDLEDNWIAILGNYSVHYAADWPADTITGDYFAVFAKQLKEKIGAEESFVGIMTQGTAGDVNIWDFMHPDRLPKEHFSKSKLIGTDLANKVAASLEHLNWELDPKIEIAFEQISLKVRKPNKEELNLAIKSFVENDFQNLNLKLDMVQRIYDREQILLNEYNENSSQTLQIIKIGNLLIGALPGEFFSETGLKLKKLQNKNRYFSICLANSYGGYVPPAHEIARGGYETWRARSSFLEEKAEEKIREKLSVLIQKLS